MREIRCATSAKEIAKTYKKSRKTSYKIRIREVLDKRKISSGARFFSAFLVP